MLQPPVQHAGFFAKLDRQTQVRLPSRLFDAHATRAGVLAADGFVQRAHGGPGDVQRGEHSFPVREVFLHKTVAQKSAHGLMCRAGGLQRRGHQIGPTQVAQQGFDKLVLTTGQRQVAAIGRGVNAVEGRTAPRAFMRGHGRPVLGKGRAHDIGRPGQERVVHGDVQVVPLATGLALEQGHQDAR